MAQSTVSKSYWIVRHADQWHLCVGDQHNGILCSENRADLIKVACRLGAERGTPVFILGEQENLEAKLSFHEGSLTIDGPTAGDLAPELLWMQQSMLARQTVKAPRESALTAPIVADTA
jgi:hypothetical protein